MKWRFLVPLTLGISLCSNGNALPTDKGLASWYGEGLRGRAMANGEPFNPDKFTAASWFYPLGSKVRVSTAAALSRSVVVTITDRGPARRLVNQGRVIDLSRGAFCEIADPNRGLVEVEVKLIE